MDWIEYDEDKKLFKFYPLFDWSFEDVENYIKENNVPYNSLHDKGYVSIGCEPCTKAIKPVRIFVQADGGGRMTGPKNADVILNKR